MPNEGRSLRDRMLAGELYVADDPVLAEESRRAMALVEAINGSLASDPAMRRRLFAELLGTYGEGAEIRPPFFCDYGYQTHVGVRSSPALGGTNGSGPNLSSLRTMCGSAAE